MNYQGIVNEITEYLASLHDGCLDDISHNRLFWFQTKVVETKNLDQQLLRETFREEFGTYPSKYIQDEILRMKNS